MIEIGKEKDPWEVRGGDPQDSTCCKRDAKPNIVEDPIVLFLI